MWHLLRIVAWIACAVYSTIPSFWLLIHPRAVFWRSLSISPYKILLPAWIGMWALACVITAPWHSVTLYSRNWMLIPAGLFFIAGMVLYKSSLQTFTVSQLGGVPEVLSKPNSQLLVTSGIRGRVRHPVYLAHLSEMLAWSAATGLVVCWALTVFAVATGAIMIKAEDEEMERRFGEQYRRYRSTVPAFIPKLSRVRTPITNV